MIKTSNSLLKYKIFKNSLYMADPNANYPDDIVVLPSRWLKSTKQLATLGPASNTFEMIEKLFLAGADIFRLNFSHGEHAEKSELVNIIRKIEAKYNHPICILADLQGPKLRVGTFDSDSGVVLNVGQSFTFDLKDEPGDSYRVKLPHPEILNTLEPGDELLLDDGKLRMTVTSTDKSGSDNISVTCRVDIGGKLSNRKGVNTPSVVLPISPLTAKDRKDLDFVLTLEIDWVALSFVQTPDDIREIQAIVGDQVHIMAKLEKPSAIDYLEEIVELSDGIMVARGDLGVEMNPWDVPVIQKRIVETCKKFGRPCVIATQMMESMIENPTPTRAEASDCATAIFDSSDAVMLSAESAAGQYPIESVRMQQQVITRVESDTVYKSNLARFALSPPATDDSSATNSAIVLAARQVAEISGSKAIIAFSSSGGTVIRVSQMRPSCPIIAITYNKMTARFLSMVWGVYPIVLAPPSGDFSIGDEIVRACAEVRDRGFIDDAEKDLLTVTAGLPFGTPGTTNVLRVVSALGPDHWFRDGDDTVRLASNKYKFEGRAWNAVEESVE